MVMMNMEAKQVGKMVQVVMDIQGEKGHLTVEAEGVNYYEALGACFARLMQQETLTNDLKVTWIRVRPQTQECTVIQELQDGQPVNVRWGNDLFADLFAPVYTYLKDL